MDTITALHYQLAALRRSAELEALVLVDDAGCLVAGAGAWPVCEELAAYAPLLADPARVIRRVVSARIATLSNQVETVELEALGQPLFLSCRGGLGPRAEALSRAATGVRRILEAA
ncbi:MAG TPA: hypothetical protein VL400_03885 [Polyangiaceae bacterium]|jgi:hypothetical protein|nr:hypothetical protein [Polyangiaceae bacterium]